MKLEQYFTRNIEILKRDARRSRPITTSCVMRLCGIGFAMALHTIERAIGIGVLERIGENYQFIGESKDAFAAMRTEAACLDIIDGGSA